MTPLDILANDINQHCPDLAENYCGDTHCTACLANALHNAGYRKQKEGEWISVDERLPELESTRSDGYHRPRSVRVLCVCEQRSGKVFVKEGYYELFGKTVCWRIPGSIDSITHWMPLPEAPKMKGGAE